jgi:tripartite-type tricarboxylate transporter receptor subunit TctC
VNNRDKNFTRAKVERRMAQIEESVACYLLASPACPKSSAGRLRALAVATATRWDALPDISTVSEFVPGYEAS